VEITQKPLFALGLRLIAVAVLATLLMLVKFTAQSGVALAEILFWRQALTVPILLAWLGWGGQISRLRTNRLPIHGRRAVIGVTGMFLNFGAVTLLPLAEATTLGFTTPIFAVILSALLLREKIGPVRWLAVALGFAGVIIITQPGHSTIPLTGAAVGLAAGFMVALISIQVRDLARTDEPLSIVFWFAALSVPFLALALPSVVSRHSPQQWALLMAIGVIGGGGQLLLTASLRFGQVASVIVMDYSALIWATLFGWLVWDHLPPAATWLGAPVIIAAGIVIVWREHRLNQRSPPTAATAAQ
jgi:drug/metabolite transporter (DMT)-like permease